MGSIELPGWAQVSEKRRSHIARVTALLEHWAAEMRIGAEERSAWRDAGRWHDALRDAPDSLLREMTGIQDLPAEMLHGPAAATRLTADGETRTALLDAIRWHTVGCEAWERVGRALYMADFLEPGRKFSRRTREFLARQVPDDFDGVFHEVLRQRLEWALREGHSLHPQTVALWNQLA